MEKILVQKEYVAEQQSAYNALLKLLCYLGGIGLLMSGMDWTLRLW